MSPNSFWTSISIIFIRPNIERYLNNHIAIKKLLVKTQGHNNKHALSKIISPLCDVNYLHLKDMRLSLRHCQWIINHANHTLTLAKVKHLVLTWHWMASMSTAWPWAQAWGRYIKTWWVRFFFYIFFCKIV